MRSLLLNLLRMVRVGARRVGLAHGPSARRRLYEPDLTLLKLEPRRLLNADFSLVADSLQLDFTAPDATDTLTVSRDGDDYRFELGTGQWRGSDTGNIVGDGTNALLVDAGFANGLLAGVGVRDDGDLGVVLTAADFSGLSAGVSFTAIDSIESSSGPFAVPQLLVRSLSPTPFSVTQVDIDGDVSFTAAGPIEDGGGTGVLRVTGDLTVVAGELATDLNGDLVVNEADLTLWQDSFGATDGRGDANADGIADAADFAAIRNALGQVSDAGTSSIELGTSMDVQVGGTAVFVSRAGGEIRLGVLGSETDSGQLVELGQLSFQTTGDLQVIEDSAEGLSLTTNDFFGDSNQEANQADDLFLKAGRGDVRLADLQASTLKVEASRAIEDANTALSSFIQVTGDAQFSAGLAGGSLAADFDNNGVIDEADLAIWRDNFGAADGRADANGDGLANGADYAIWRNSLPGANGITLGNQLNLSIGGQAVFASQNGGDLSIGESRSADLANVRFATTGDVRITEQSVDGLRLKRDGVVKAGAGKNVSLTATSGPLVLDTLDADTLAVSSAGAITDEGLITVGQMAQFNSTGPGADLVLDQLAVTGAIGVTTTESTSGARDADATIVNATGIDFKASVVQGDLLATALSGDVTNSAGEVTVAGQAFFTATTGNVTLGDTNAVLAETISLDGNDVSFSSTPAVALAEVLANSLFLQAAGGINDTAGASILVNSDATFAASGGDITLANNASDTLTVGGLVTFDGDIIARNLLSVGQGGAANFGSLSLLGGDAIVNEASSTNLVDVDVTSLSLTSGQDISDTSNLVVAGDASFSATGSLVLNDNVGDTLVVGGNAAFSAASITLGDAGTFTAGTLSFNSPGVVTIQEDDATALAGTNTAGALALSSNAAITDVSRLSTTPSLAVRGDASFTAAGAITLADAAGESITIDDQAAFLANLGGLSDVSIGQAGTANFGSLRVVADEAVIRESSGTRIDGIEARTLALESSGSVTDLAGAQVQITEDATVSAGPTGAIFLAGVAADLLDVGGHAEFVAGGAIAIGAAGVSTFGQLSLQGSVVEVQEDDSTMLVRVSASALDLTASGDIVDVADAHIAVTGNAAFQATGAITLSDTGTDTNAANDDLLTVGGMASFVSGGDITIGLGGQTEFGTLSVTGKAVAVEEDDSTLLKSVSSTSLNLSSDGAITDNAHATIQVSEDASFSAASSITLNDSAADLPNSRPADVLSVGGKATFVVAPDNASGSITVGPDGQFMAGMLSFNAAGDVVIQEDDATNIAMSNTAANLLLSSEGDITLSGQVAATGFAKFVSAGSIALQQDLFATQVGLFSSAGISQSGGGIIAGELLASVSGSGNVVLDSSSNAAPRFAAEVREGSIDFFTTTDLTVANLTIDGMNIAGVQITDVASASSHTLQLEAAGGNIQQEQQPASDARIDVDVLTATFVVADGHSILLDDLGIATNSAFSTTNNRFFNDNPGALRETDLVFMATGSGTAVEDLVVVEQSAVLLSGIAIQGDLSVAAGRSTDTAAPYLGQRAIVDDSTVSVAGTARLHAFGGAMGVLAIETDQLAIAGADLSNVGNVAVTTDQGDASIRNQTSVAFRNDFASNVQGDLAIDSSTGAITDAAGVSVFVLGNASLMAFGDLLLNDTAAGSTDVLTVGGKASLTAANISVGATGEFTAGQLQFNSLGAVTIQEDDSSEVAMANTAGSLSLASEDLITDATGASIIVDGDASFLAATSLVMNDTAGDVLNVGGKASFTVDPLEPTGSITVGPNGQFLAGSLRFNAGGLVTIQEDTSAVDPAPGTEIAMSNTAGTLILRSEGAITDALGTSIVVGDDGSFDSAVSIDLNDSVGDSLSVGSKATFAVDSSSSVDTINIGDDGVFLAGSLNFNADGAVTIQEDSSVSDLTPGTVLAMTSTAGSLTLESDGPVSDAAGTSVQVTGDATLTAGSAGIALNDVATDELIVGGKAAFAGDSITIGNAGLFLAGTLNFNAPGAVSIQEDTAPTDPAPGTAISMANTAGTLLLSSDGSITDTPMTQINVTGAASFTALPAGADITLADDANDVLIVGLLAEFNAADDIAIGPAGLANFRTLSLSGDTASVFEDSSTEFDSVSVRELTMRATGGITDIASASITVAETATFDTGSPFEDVVLGDGPAELRLGTVRFFGDAGLPGDVDRQVAQHVSLQEIGGFQIGDTRVSGTYFATAVQQGAASGAIEQAPAAIPGDEVLEARALGLKTPDAGVLIQTAQVESFAAEAGGAVDVTGRTGDLLVRLNDERIDPDDDTGLAPTELVGNDLTRLAVDSLFGVTLLANRGDLSVQRVIDATQGAPAGAADGIRATSGHAFVETIADGSELGDLLFDGDGATDNRAVLIDTDHVFTAVAAGSLDINTTASTDLVANGVLGGGQGVVTDVSGYLSYDDRDGFTTGVTDITAGTVSKEGALLRVTPPDTLASAPTTRLVVSDNSFTQSVELEIGRPRETNFILQIVWADRELPGDPPGGVTRVPGQEPIEGVYIDATTQAFTHAFNPQFLNVENATRDYGPQPLVVTSLDLPTDIVVLNDPRINLFSEGGSQNLNRSVTPTASASPQRSDNFVLATTQTILILQDQLGTVESPIIFAPPGPVAIATPAAEPLPQQAFAGRAVVATQELVQIEYGPLDEAEYFRTGEVVIIQGEVEEWEEGPANYVASIKQKVLSDQEQPAGRYVIKATSNNNPEPETTTFEKRSSVVAPYHGAGMDVGQGPAELVRESQTEALAEAWTAAWLDWANEAEQTGERGLQLDDPWDLPLPTAIEERSAEPANAANHWDDSLRKASDADALMVGAVLQARRTQREL